MDSIQKKMNSIQVAIKARPLIKREIEEGLGSHWEIQGNSIIAKDHELRKRSDHRFAFDHVFDEESTNEEVFQVIVKPIIDAAVNGFNGTVFAYGQTSSGKTYTMMGSDEEPGITQLAVKHMFAAINETKDREFLLRVSSLEIYNEKVKDLLAIGDSKDLEIKIQEGGLINVSCKEDVINSPERIFDIMKLSEKNRKTGETNMNDRSSRGHTIFRITIESRALGSDSDGVVQVSQINLVDLAGSERQSQTGATGERFKEGTHINLSLTALGRVIQQLSEAQDYVSFRDSKLTRLLQNSLGGNALTAVICAVTPASLDETVCSLSFASRAKSVKTKPQLNEVMSDAALLKRYAKHIARLQAELETVKKDNRSVKVQEMEFKLQEKDKKNQLLQRRIDFMKVHLLTGHDAQKEETAKLSSRRRTWAGSGTLKGKSSKIPGLLAMETITEMSPEKPTRKSIIQTDDFTNESFEGYADFEVELIKSERNRLAISNSQDRIEDKVVARRPNSVKHIDYSTNTDVLEDDCRSHEKTSDFGCAKRDLGVDNSRLSGDVEKTPTKKNTSVQTTNILSSPGTPRQVLRDTVSATADELKELQEFTTLEKQILCDEFCTHAQKLQKLEEEVVQINFEKSDLERNICELKTEVKKQKEELDCKQKSIMQDNEDLLRKLKGLTDSKMALGECNAKLALDLHTKTEEFEEEKRKASERNEDLLKQIKDLKDMKTSLEKENEKLAIDLNEKDRECEAIRKEASLNNEDFLKKMNDIVIAKEALEVANTKLLEERKNNEYSVEEIQGKSLEINKDMENKIKDLIDDKMSLEETIAKLQEDLQSKDNELMEVQKDAMEHNEEHLKQIKELTNTKINLEDANAKLAADLQQNVIKLEEMQNKIILSDELTEKVIALTDRNTSLEDTNAKLMIDLQEKEKVAKEYENIVIPNNDDFLKEFKELTKAKTCLEEMNCKLMVDLEGVTRQLEDIRKKECYNEEINDMKNTEDLLKQIQELSKTKALLEETNTKLTQDHEEAVQALENVQEQTKEKSEKFTMQLNELTKMNQFLEEKSSELTVQLKIKLQESDDIQKDISSLRTDVKKFEETIHLLTSENSKLYGQLTTQLRINQEMGEEYQKTVHQLHEQISTLTNEKKLLEENISVLQEKLKDAEFRLLQVADDNIEQTVSEYQRQINLLRQENIELTEKVTELSEQHESKSLEFDHDCLHKEKLSVLQKKITQVEEENIELSNDLMEKVSEYDDLQKEYTTLKEKYNTVTDVSINFATDDASQLKEENTELKSQIVELRAKLSTLLAENEHFAKFYSEFVDQCDCVQNANNLDSSKLNLSTLLNVSTTDPSDAAISMDNSVKMTDLHDQVNHLKSMNKRLAELKLGPCTKCKYMKEINDKYRANKLHVNMLERKLDLYKRQLKHESIEAERLVNKTHEDLNLSGYDSPLNSTLQDGMNLTYAEEKLESIRNELESIKENDGLSRLVIENNIENIPIQVNDSVSAGMQKINQKSQIPKPTNNLKLRIGNIEKDLNKLSNKLVDMKKDVDKYILMEKEMSSLKSINAALEEQLAKSEMATAAANDTKNILEEEVSNLMGRIEELSQKEKAVEESKLLLTVEIEDLKSDQGKKNKHIEDLHKTINELNENLSTLTSEVDVLKKLNEDLCRSKEFIEKAHSEQLTDVKKSFEKSCKEYEEKLIKKDEDLVKTINDNENLQRKIVALEKNIQDRIAEVKLEHEKSFDNVENLKGELDNIKKTIIKEINCLKPKDDLESLTSKSTDELFRSLNNAIISKELEIAKVLQEKYNREKQELEYEKQQSIDAEKRMTLYVKSLESDSEKLQKDLTEQERWCKTHEEKVSQLEYTLKETNKEKSMLMNKVETLEAEYNNLQVSLEKQSQVEVKQEEVYNPQKIEKLIQVAVANKETELQSRFNLEKEEHECKLVELISTIDALKTKNMELKNNIEGLEANEKQLKNVIDLKSKEILKSNQNITELNTELTLLKNDFNDLSREVEEKKSRLNEISAIMKTKCDSLSEYKTKLDEIMPKYETLLSQSQERKLFIERCKTELENVKMEKQKEIDTLNDRLNSETVKCTSLNKQIIELKNKNITLLSELNELNIKYEALQTENTKLERKIRHSTSKIKAEADVEELKDLTKSLQNNLDGASNRISELQENKNRLLTELMDLKGQYDLMSQENDELKKHISSYKSKLDDFDLLDLRTKYDDLLQKKNTVALELEGKKLLLVQKDKNIENLTNQIKSLTEKNKELDDECNELANDIRTKNVEYAELEEKYFSLLVENQKDQSADITMPKSTNDKETNDLREQNEKLLKEIELLRKIEEAHNTCSKKLNSTDSKMDCKSKNSSTLCRDMNTSSNSNNRRRRSRNDIFYQRRQLDDNSDIEENIEDRCEVLRKKIHELELELVSKNGKIATLEMQIQSESFPYQRKCHDLEEKLLAVANKNTDLKSEVKRLQRAMQDIGSKECDICRRWQINRRDQTTQTMPDNAIRFCGTTSGVVDDYIKMQKLEKAHIFMKNLCRTRNRRIHELEERIKELEEKENRAEGENALEIPQGYTKKLSDSDTNYRLALNDNIQPNILGNVFTSNYTRRAWRDY